MEQGSEDLEVSVISVNIPELPHGRPGDGLCRHEVLRDVSQGATNALPIHSLRRGVDLQLTLCFSEQVTARFALLVREEGNLLSQLFFVLSFFLSDLLAN